jgi:thiamine biosynthesis protein ThiI
MQAMLVTNAVCTLPVFRPVVGMDKEEIITIARKIDTMETSILPYEDCCTVFTPRHPKTRPSLSEIEKAEAELDIEALVNEAVEGTEMVHISCGR